MPPGTRSPRLDEIERELGVHALGSQWRSEIDHASTETALIALARRYMLRTQSAFVAGLPGVAPLPRLAGPGDVSLITYRLRRLYCSPTLEAPHVALVEQVLAFFDALSERIFDLRCQEEARQRPLPARISASG